MSNFSHSHIIWRATCAITLLVSLAACNTIGGAGRDVSAVGHSVSNGASAARP